KTAHNGSMIASSSAASSPPRSHSISPRTGVSMRHPTPARRDAGRGGVRPCRRAAGLRCTLCAMPPSPASGGGRAPRAAPAILHASQASPLARWSGPIGSLLLLLATMLALTAVGYGADLSGNNDRGRLWLSGVLALFAGLP